MPGPFLIKSWDLCVHFGPPQFIMPKCVFLVVSCPRFVTGLFLLFLIKVVALVCRPLYCLCAAVCAFVALGGSLMNLFVSTSFQ